MFWNQSILYLSWQMKKRLLNCYIHDLYVDLVCISSDLNFCLFFSTKISFRSFRSANKMNDNGPLLHPQRQMMNKRSKRQNPDAPIQPKLKKLRSDVSVKVLHADLDSNEEKLSFLSTLLCLLSKGTWFRIVEEDDKKQSIYHN